MKKKATTAKAPVEFKTPDWYDLLTQAVYDPGLLRDTRKFFHNYSLSNRWMAATQLTAAGLPLMPINTHNGWKRAGRHVMAGQKSSVAMLMPVPIRKPLNEGETRDAENEVVFTKFMLRNFWFHLEQTEGEPFEAVEAADAAWQLDAAVKERGYQYGTFSFTGISDLRNSYVADNQICISPLATEREYTTLLELSRLALGHYEAHPAKAVPDEVSLRDIEAEVASYLVMGSVGLPGMESSRAKLQSLLDDNKLIDVPHKQINRAFGAADKIINSGYC